MSYGAACHFGLKYGSCRAISRAADSNCCEDRWCFEYEHQAAQGLYTSASATAARPDMYRDCTWLCPLCVPSGESTREPKLLAHLNLSRRCTPGKSSTASAVQTSEVQTVTRGEPQSGASQKIDAEHFAGSTTAMRNPALLLLMSPSSTFVAEHVGNF
jgi:hypothetical protein